MNPSRGICLCTGFPCVNLGREYQPVLGRGLCVQKGSWRGTTRLHARMNDSGYSCVKAITDFHLFGGRNICSNISSCKILTN